MDTIFNLLWKGYSVKIILTRFIGHHHYFSVRLPIPFVLNCAGFLAGCLLDTTLPQESSRYEEDTKDKVSQEGEETEIRDGEWENNIETRLVSFFSVCCVFSNAIFY